MNEWMNEPDVTIILTMAPTTWTTERNKKQDTENLDGYAPNITKAFKQQKTCSFRDASSSSSRIPNTNSRFHVTDTDINIVDGITITELDENNIIEGAARSKVSRSSANSEMLLLGLSGTSPFSSISLSKSYPLVLILCLLFCNSFRISLLQLQQVWVDYQLLSTIIMKLSETIHSLSHSHSPSSSSSWWHNELQIEWNSLVIWNYWNLNQWF